MTTIKNMRDKKLRNSRPTKQEQIVQLPGGEIDVAVGVGVFVGAGVLVAVDVLVGAGVLVVVDILIGASVLVGAGVLVGPPIMMGR